LRRPGSLQGVASTAQGATPVGRAFTQQQERPQQRNYLRQRMCARDSRIPRLRRDNDGRVAEQIRIASFSPGPIRKLTTEEFTDIAKRGLVLSRGHRADLATTRPKRIELWPGSRALLSFKTVYNTFENRRMHQCWWGGCGHVMALHSMPAEWANGFGSGCAHFWRQSH
jgi:hypothetical protein